MKTAAGFPLEMTRRYLSSQVADGPMGYGWMPSVISRLSYATYQFSAGVYQKRAYVLLPSGLRLMFVESGGTYTPPLGRYDTLVKNGDGSFDLTLQHSRTRLHFGATGYLIQLIDEFGNTLSYTNGPTGTKVQQITDLSGSGRYLTITWGADGRISSVGDSSGRLVQYGYELDGSLILVTDAANRETAMKYGAGRFGPLLTNITDNWGRLVSDMSYEPGTDRVKTYSEDGEVYTLFYNHLGNPSWIAKSMASYPTSQYVYAVDPSNGVITSFDNTAGAQATELYSDGSVKQVTDRVGVKTFFTYDVNGNVSRVTRNYQPQSGVAVPFDYTYDATFAEKVATIKAKKSDGTLDPDWAWWQYDYYQPGSTAPGALWKVRRNGFNPPLATYEYDSRGRVTKFTEALGDATTKNTAYAYDGSGNLFTVTLPPNNDAGTRPVLTYGYDGLGRVTSVTDPLGKVTSYTYDALDRVTSITLPNISTTPGVFTTTYSYDNYDSGSQTLFTRVTDPNGIVTQQGYDQFGELVRSIDGVNHETSYTYLRGQVDSVTDANGYATTYHYDAAGRLTATTFADGSTETYVARADGLVGSVTRGGVTVQYSYDPLKRLTTKAKAPGNLDRFVYTYTGQKLTKAQGYGVNGALVETTTLGYDSFYRVSSVSGPRGTMAYSWRSDDRMAWYKVDGAATPTASYGYYGDGSVKTITWVPTSPSPSYLFTYLYDLAGRYSKLTYPNGQHRDYAYDEQGRLLSLSSKTSTNANLATYSYGYDLNYTTSAWDRKGQRVSMTASVPSMSTEDGISKYEYDALYQLTRATPPLASQATWWSYDAVGNRLTESTSASTTNYGYQKIGTNPNNWQRLLSTTPGESFGYDGRGNVTARTAATTTYGLNYNWANQLDRIDVSPPTATFTYDYDYDGRRVAKNLGGSQTHYLYNGLDIVREKTGALPNLTYAADYLYGPGVDQPIAIKRLSTVYYYFVDGLGSVRLVTDTSSLVKDKYSWGPWGTGGMANPPVANPLGYTAREIGDAQDHYYRARYYYPTVGRFLAPDPLGSDASLYAYASNRPVQWRDPNGLQPDPILSPHFPFPIPDPARTGPPSRSGEWNFYYYGNWGGPGWAGGQWVDRGAENLTPDGARTPPIDPQDNCFRAHDLCFADCRKMPFWPCFREICPCERSCDRALAECLRHNGHGFRGAMATGWSDWNGNRPCPGI